MLGHPNYWTGHYDCSQNAKLHCSRRNIAPWFVEAGWELLRKEFGAKEKAQKSFSLRYLSESRMLGSGAICVPLKQSYCWFLLLNHVFFLANFFHSRKERNKSLSCLYMFQREIGNGAEVSVEQCLTICPVFLLPEKVTNEQIYHIFFLLESLLSYLV